MSTQPQLKIIPNAYGSNSLLCALLYGLLIIALLQPFSQAAAATSDDSLILQTELKEHLRTLDTLVAADNSSLEERVVVVNFFASWCPPCLNEFKALNDIKQQMATEKLTIIAVNVFEAFDDNDEARMTNFLQTTKPEFLVLKGTEQSLELFGDIRRIPTLLIFDKGGNLAFDFIHAQNAKKRSVNSKELLSAIQPLL